MPRVRRARLPDALYQHLLDRVQGRQIPSDQLVLFATWLDTLPEVPHGPWFKRFPRMIVCGDGELVKTFLIAGQVPHGEEVF